MRKQTKILVATALLALGASFTSMAAAKTGTWMLEDDGWYCYDKDGDAYEDEFCLSYGKEYYMGDDGLMVTSSWVEYETDWYYVGSDGAKTINDWRFVAPEDDDEADEEWFYFGSKGKMVTGKKVIDGKTYYFDEDGKMLTGWVEYSEKKAKEAEMSPDMDALVYCDENGARVSSAWVKTWVPGTDVEDQDDADLFWYWIKAKGGVEVGKNNDINGETYFFGEDGKMLSGWVIATGSDADEYEEINNTSTDVSGATVYYCGTGDQGWAKKNTWIKTWAPAQWDDADDDNTTYWYWIAKNGEVFAPASASAANSLVFEDGEESTPIVPGTTNDYISFKEIGKKTYAFKNNGQMWSGLVDTEEGMYYFGGSDDGSMKTGDVMIEDEEGYEYKFFFGEKDSNGYTEGVAVTGAADGELYVDGLLQTTDNKFAKVDVEVDGVKVSFIIDADGDIRTTKKVYENADDELVFDASKTTFNDGKAKSTLKGSF